MSSSRQLHLGAFMRPISIHTAAWRYPGAYADANFNFEHITQFAQTLERGKFDAFFMADHLAVLNMPVQALKRSATVTSFDPLTLLPALAVLTKHLGLIATASTTYNEPYHVARKFASLDHISGGRAGWNVVTSGNPDEAMNFGLEEHVEHSTRYRRYVSSHDMTAKAHLLRQARGRKHIASPRGFFYDLDQIFEDLNQRFFFGLLARPQMTWSRLRARNSLGHYDPAHNAIVVSRVFDHAQVPRYAIDYIVYHEMLHLKHPVKLRGSRRCVHGPEFQAEEKLFPQLEDAKQFLKRL